MLKRMTQDETQKDGPVSFLRRHGREALDLAALATALIFTGIFIAVIPAAVVLCAVVAAAVIPLRSMAGPPGPWREFRAAAPRRLGTVAACAVLLHYFLAQPLGSLWFGAVWPVAGWLVGMDWPPLMSRCGSGLRRAIRWISNPTLQEFARALILVAVALWLF